MARDCRSSPPPAGAAGQPLVLSVGRMGRRYWSWVDQPVAGQPRFFGPDWMESCSKTEWWVVPALWLPIYGGLTWAASADLGHDIAQLLPLQLVGVVLWQLLEYLIHRFLFHATSDSYWGITLHFLFHGCHHKFPMDAQRLVFPPLPAAPIAAAIYAALRLLLQPPAAAALMAGVLLGYVAYDCLHYAIHHAKRLPGPLLSELRARHNHHHYRDHHHSYGISSVFFDLVFGTRAALPGSSGSGGGGGSGNGGGSGSGGGGSGGGGSGGGGSGGGS